MYLYACVVHVLISRYYDFCNAIYKKKRPSSLYWNAIILLKCHFFCSQHSINLVLISGIIHSPLDLSFMIHKYVRYAVHTLSDVLRKSNIHCTIFNGISVIWLFFSIEYYTVYVTLRVIMSSVLEFTSSFSF